MGGAGAAYRSSRAGRAAATVALGGLWAGLMLLSLGGASCGHQYFLDGPEVTRTPRGSATPGPTGSPTPGLVFASNSADGTLSEFSRDPVAGALTLIATIAAGAANGPTGLALDPSNSFLYAANSADHQIREFSIDSATGALTAIGSANDGPASSPQRIAIDPTGSFLYVTNGAGASISQYTISGAGTLSANGAFTANGVVVQPMGIAAAPGGDAVYVADFGSGRVLSLAIQTNGSLALAGSVASLGPNGPGQPRGIAVDPSGEFVYVADSGNGTNGVVSVFAVGAGDILTYLASNPTAAQTRATFDLALADNAAGGALYLYATNGGINTVSDFLASTGVLSLQGSTGGLTGPRGIGSDAGGRFIYVANSGTGQIFGYAVGAGGALGSIGAFNTENPANPASAPAYLAIAQ